MKFSIRRVHDDLLPSNRKALAASVDILLHQIPTCKESERERLRNCLRDPVQTRFKSVLLVAERSDRVIGFALVMHVPNIGFAWLDYLCAAPARTSGGIGTALYQRCRDEVKGLGGWGLFYECLSDEPALLRECDQPLLDQNKARLRFYEGFGARPILHTLWDVPEANPDTQPITHLMCDTLGDPTPPRKKQARAVVRAVLERRYAGQVAPVDVEAVTASIKEDPVVLRPLRYRRKAAAPLVSPHLPPPIAMVVSENHQRHLVHERGYYETPVRIASILKPLRASGLTREIPSQSWNDRPIRAVHDACYLSFLDEIAEAAGTRTIYPDVFPIRNRGRLPKDPIARAGWYCIDTFTPLSADAVAAARAAVDCTLTAASALLKGEDVAAYALVRPPGHHAEARLFGGYCYYNHAAIAASWLARRVGKVAILDVDFHHGNGQQQIFYHDDGILTVSIHGDPATHYPYFSGYADECGAGKGRGFNLNIPLPDGMDGADYRKQGLLPALERIRAFEPSVLVVALGVDTGRGDPTGAWRLETKDFLRNGALIGELDCPCLVVQEGGYRTARLGHNVTAFLQGIAQVS